MNVYIWKDVQPLNFTANTAGSTIKLNKTGSPTAVTIETSTDWNNWSTYTFGDTITLTNIWDKVYFRNASGTDTWFSTGNSNYHYFVMSWSIAWSGDITSLINKNFSNTVYNYCFISLFMDCTSLTTPPELPATTLGNQCYNSMFYWCSNLTTAPNLPATELKEACYYQMFRNCTSLTTPPDLSSTTLASQCYGSMFNWCSSLTKTPSLPATTLYQYCYTWMFAYCPNITTLPNLPATTLANNCYQSMFAISTNIKLSTTQTWEYQTPYRIPTTWTWSVWTDSIKNMFVSTWWTFTWTPSINTTYYTSNTVV